MEITRHNTDVSRSHHPLVRRRWATWFGWLAFTLWVLITVDGLWPQAQMALLGGGVVVPNVAIKFLFLAVLFGAVICGRRVSLPWQLRVPYVLFLVYLVLDAQLLFLLWPPYSLEYVLFGYNAYFFWLVSVAFFPLTALSVRERSVVWSLLLLFIPLAMLGVIQHALGLPILATASTEGPYAYATMSDAFFGQVRAFSLFTSPLEFGTFVAVLACITMSQALATGGRKRRLWAVVFVATVFVAYCTLTRVVYIETLFGCTSLVFIRGALKSERKQRKVRLLPLVYGVAAAGLAFWLGPLVATSSESLVNGGNLFGRIALWSKYFSVWTGGGLFRFLLGTGLVQNNRFLVSSEVVIDNTFLAVATQVGLVGLVLWCYLMWRLWRFMLDGAFCYPSPLRVALAAFFSAWIAAATFNIIIGPFTAVVWLYVAAIPAASGCWLSSVPARAPRHSPPPAGRLGGRHGGLAGVENPA